MKALVVLSVLYCSIAAPVLVFQGRMAEAGIYIAALVLARHWWRKHEG